MEKTITINTPQPGDSLPFVVLRNEDLILEYNYQGEVIFRTTSSSEYKARNIARLLGIPEEVKVEYNPKVAEVKQ